MTPPEVDDIEEILRMVNVLSEVGYRDLARDVGQQRLAVCRRLWREGVTERILRMLWHYAQACGNNPSRLFCWWIARPSRTIGKINEMRERDGWARRVVDGAIQKEKAREKPAQVHSMEEFRRRNA